VLGVEKREGGLSVFKNIMLKGIFWINLGEKGMKMS
jgi:hypothetical protein